MSRFDYSDCLAIIRISGVESSLYQTLFAGYELVGIAAQLGGLSRICELHTCARRNDMRKSESMGEDGVSIKKTGHRIGHTCSVRTRITVTRIPALLSAEIRQNSNLKRLVTRRIFDRPSQATGARCE